MQTAQIPSISPLPPPGDAPLLLPKGQTNDRNLMHCILQELELLQSKEQQLIELLKQRSSSETGDKTTKSVELPSVAKFVQDYRETLKNKESLLSSLMENPQEPAPAVQFDQHVLSIVTQPSEVLIANRYVLPAPVVASSYPPSQNSLIIRADLLYNTTKTAIESKNGKRGVLEGVLEISPDRNGQAIFSKLKLKEVSSKHEHQSFVFSFSLEEYSAHGAKRVVDVIYSTSFHVQSYKRPTKKRKLSPEIQDSQRPKLSKGANVQDKYVDITSLLVLPQKDAAQTLGISESMLCKRFKECTQRKWPYRYLQKIDKVIHILKLRRKEGSFKEEEGKLDRLMQEREQILQPVTIRITSHDRQESSLESSESAEEPDSQEELSDQDLQTIVESLQMLQKSQVIH